MRIAVLGTGMVGSTIATKLVELGHDVRMGARAAGSEKAVAWSQAAGGDAGEGSFADVAAFAELVVNCTAGVHSLAAIEAAGRDNLAGKVLVDVANALDFSGGMPPTLAVSNTDSLAEQIQRAFPETKVVKALNTMSCDVMVEPGKVPGDHVTFVCGDDAGAKGQVAELLRSFGWPAARILDLGGIRSARGLEMYLPLWLSMMAALETRAFNIGVLSGD